MLKITCPIKENASCIFWTQTKYVPNKILQISPYSVQMQENADQSNSEYGHSEYVVYVSF